jgi:glycosyltransferase involved in cell wall biosynthesis
LLQFKQTAESLADHVDSAWYLKTYPDVAAAGVDPRQHFVCFGRFENRAPRELLALRCEDDLWSGDQQAALAQLQGLLTARDSEPVESCYAAWALARWHGSFGRWPEALEALRVFAATPLGPALVTHSGPVLLACTALRETGATAEAHTLLAEQLAARGRRPDLLLEAASQADGADILNCLNELFEGSGLSSVAARREHEAVSLDNLGMRSSRKFVPTILAALLRAQQPLVSIIIPAYNAQHVIATALLCLQQQTWRNLEILVVDDASPDATAELVEGFTARDRRIRLLRQTVNQGAYAARNSGLAIARGEFLTVHDSDDWSHPEKIERQVRALLANKELQASVSHWARCTPSLCFFRERMEEGYTHLNLSSLMFRRKVFATLGYWDRVSVGADTEYYHRIIRAFGTSSVGEMLPGVPLAFGRHDPSSLTQVGATHWSTLFKGVRRDYYQAALKWHSETLEVKDLYLGAKLCQRPFPAPADICRTSPATFDLTRELLEASDFFDAEWYLSTYPDVAAAGFDPRRHYRLHGASEDRDPGPGFSSSGYRYAYSEQFNPGSSLAHYLLAGQQQGLAPLPLVPGLCPRIEGARTVLVCGHLAGDQAFGAERSMLDVLSSFGRLGYNVLVSLPAAGSSDYLEAVRARAAGVWILPYRWWRGGRPACQETVELFAGFIREHQVDVVLLNTVVLFEPAVAAKQCGVPVIVHARELPAHDPALCGLLNADAATIREHLLALADQIIANSAAVEHYLDAPGRTTLVPDCLDATSFDLPQRPDPARTRVGLVSSNLPKKGLADFVEMARLLEKGVPDLECVLIGPENEHVHALRDSAAKGELPGNMVFAGYAKSPGEAMAQIEILVNLSHVQESFGRTVLEAMAARRAVVCYDWGALGELVVDGETGYLVPFGEVNAVARRVRELCEDPDLCQRMGAAGRVRAVEYFGPTSFDDKLRGVLEKLYCKPRLDP